MSEPSEEVDRSTEFNICPRQYERHEHDRYYMSIDHLRDGDSDSEAGSDSEEECNLDDEGAQAALESADMSGEAAERLLSRSWMKVVDAGGKGKFDSFLEKSKLLSQSLLENESAKSFHPQSDLDSSEDEDSNGLESGGGGGGGDLCARKDHDVGRAETSDSGSDSGEKQTRSFFCPQEDEDDEVARKTRLPEGAIDIGSLCCAGCFNTVTRLFEPLHGNVWLCLDAPETWGASGALGGSECMTDGEEGLGGAEGGEEEQQWGSNGWKSREGLTIGRDESVSALDLGLKAWTFNDKNVLPPSAPCLSGAKRKSRTQVEEGGRLGEQLHTNSERPRFLPLRCNFCKGLVGGVEVQKEGLGKAVLVAVLPCE